MLNVTLAFEPCCVTKMRLTRVCMGTLWVCFKYLKFNVLQIKLTALLSFRILYCFTLVNERSSGRCDEIQ